MMQPANNALYRSLVQSDMRKGSRSSRVLRLTYVLGAGS